MKGGGGEISGGGGGGELVGGGDVELGGGTPRFKSVLYADANALKKSVEPVVGWLKVPTPSDRGPAKANTDGNKAGLDNSAMSTGNLMSVQGVKRDCGKAFQSNVHGQGLPTLG